MHKTYSITFCVAAIALLVWNHQVGNQESRAASSFAGAGHLQSRNDALEREARQFANKHWEGLLTKCGDSYYWKEVWGESDQIYYQAKGEPSFSFEGRYVPPRTLSKAEQLNGEDPQPIEFEGATLVTFDVGRILKGVPCTLAVCQWKDRFRIGERIVKSKGVMRFDRNRGVRERKPVDCSEVLDRTTSSDPSERRGLELDEFCAAKYEAQSAVAVFTPGDALSWRCKVQGKFLALDMEEACEKQHGSFSAVLDDKNDPKSWYCRPRAPQAGNGPPRIKVPPRAAVSGGVLNAKATSKPTPVYPAKAKAAKVSGTVVVQVVVDEAGNVEKAQAVSGHPLLLEAAVEAAKNAKFAPVLLQGQPAKVNGVLIYNFAL